MRAEVWKPNQRLSVRSIEGKLNSCGRIAYCDPTQTGNYAIGLELTNLPRNGSRPQSHRASFIATDLRQAV